MEKPKPVISPKKLFRTATDKAWKKVLLVIFGIVLAPYLWWLYLIIYVYWLVKIWKNPKWRQRSKVILTALPIALVALIISLSLFVFYHSAPEITLSNGGNGKQVESADYKVEGTVSPSFSTLTINGVKVNVNQDGKFSHTLTLTDGNNVIVLDSTNDGKTTEVKQEVKKLTAAEIAKIKADADAKAKEAAKRKADADAAAKAAADAKAKADADKTKAEADAQAKANAPAEYKSALSQADSYANTMHMSKQGVYDQLVSEYGGKFSTAAAQYAIDNVVSDWNANALAKAKNYQDTMHLSPASIHDQLTSSYGERFTQAEADFAIAHLND
jgi:hypothetical protein